MGYPERRPIESGQSFPSYVVVVTDTAANIDANTRPAQSDGDESSYPSLIIRDTRERLSIADTTGTLQAQSQEPDSSMAVSGGASEVIAATTAESVSCHMGRESANNLAQVMEAYKKLDGHFTEGIEALNGVIGKGGDDEKLRELVQLVDCLQRTLRDYEWRNMDPAQHQICGPIDKDYESRLAGGLAALEGVMGKGGNGVKLRRLSQLLKLQPDPDNEAKLSRSTVDSWSLAGIIIVVATLAGLANCVVPIVIARAGGRRGRG